MSNEFRHRLQARVTFKDLAIQIAREKLCSAETQIESLIDESNPNKDALRDMKNVQDLMLQARIVLEEANR